MRCLIPALAVAVLAVCAGQAKADMVDHEPALLTLGVGGYNVLHQDKDAIFRGEYRFGTSFLYIRPIAGVEVTSAGGVYAYGGFGVNIPITDHIVLFPSGAFGYWSRGNGSKDLGSHDEFRTGAEIAWRFDDDSRIGVTFHHISNDGITQRNPGVEEALLEYSIPLGSIFP
jgi:lipid A 3-O-deacylase